MEEIQYEHGDLTNRIIGAAITVHRELGSGLLESAYEDCLAFVTWFAGGLRIMDISDPANPKERGYFIPKPGDGQTAPLTKPTFSRIRLF